MTRQRSIRRPPLWLFLCLALVAAGCTPLGPAPAGPKPRPSATARLYRDRTYHFSFGVPVGWTVQSGRYETSNGIQRYIVSVSIPGNAEQAQVTLDRNLLAYQSIPEGKEVPAGNGSFYRYHHTTLAGWPAIQVQRINSGKADEIDTIANTHDYKYDVRMVTGTPPFDASSTSGYRQIVRSLKVPF